eukprot:203366_1
MPSQSMELYPTEELTKILTGNFISTVNAPTVANCIHHQKPFQTSKKLTTWIMNILNDAIKKSRCIKHWKLGPDQNKLIRKFIIGMDPNCEFHGYCKECCWNLFVLSDQFKFFRNIDNFIDKWIWNEIMIDFFIQYQLKFILCIINHIIVCPGFVKLLFGHRNKMICISFVKGLILFIWTLGMNINMEKHINQVGDSNWKNDPNAKYEHDDAILIAWKLMQTVNMYIYDIIKFLDGDMSFFQPEPYPNRENIIGRIQNILITSSKHKAKKALFAVLILDAFSNKLGKKIMKPCKSMIRSADISRSGIKMMKIGFQKSKMYSRNYSKNLKECIVPKCRIQRRGNIKSNLFKCSACKKAKYCSRKCQKYHWKIQHRNECKQLCSN